MVQIYALFSLLTIVGVAKAVDFDWDCTNSLAPCNNACFAVNCKSKPGTLTYDSNAAARDPRRTASGCNRTPCSNQNLPYRNFGNSCDEFPFASVQEGGTGAILRCVDSTENSSEGGQLGNFYKNLNNGDQFNVFVKNFVGAPYCQNAQQCTNDGGEFRLSNGVLSNAKQRRATPLKNDFSAAKANTIAGGRSRFRRFKGDDGVERVWLGTGNAALVGTTVWDGRSSKKVKIVEELK